MQVVAKVIKETSNPDRRKYAVDEANLNLKTRQYDFMPIARYLQAFEHEDNVYLVFVHVPGVAACAQVSSNQQYQTSVPEIPPAAPLTPASQNLGVPMCQVAPQSLPNRLSNTAAVIHACILA